MPKRKSLLTKGDIYIHRGILYKIVNPEGYNGLPGEHMVEVQHVEKDECTFMDEKEILKAEYLGQDPGAVAAFYAAHGVHLRLNRIKP